MKSPHLNTIVKCCTSLVTSEFTVSRQKCWRLKMPAEEAPGCEMEKEALDTDRRESHVEVIESGYSQAVWPKVLNTEQKFEFALRIFLILYNTCHVLYCNILEYISQYFSWLNEIISINGTYVRNARIQMIWWQRILSLPQETSLGRKYLK